MIPAVYTRREVAQALKVSERTIAREQAAGRLKSLKVRGRPVFLEERVVEYMKGIEK